ncbi:ISNCY family transposase [Lichenicoccus sp.]|uniref:ISNCY family transposase n=1 Tax=Lichenicoccus sp. TaxID=2781899 RepID=UPI003D13A1F3
MGLVLMDGRELHRVGVLAEILDGGRSVASGAALLGLTARQTRRLVEKYRTRGAPSLAHALRSRPSNRRRPAALRDQVLTLIRTQYQGYGPTLASEQLLERHGLRVPRETLRGWMRAAGLWLTRAQRRTFHQSRPRREHSGELVQIDGSEHRWFGPEHPSCTLLVFIDDATSRLMQLRFVPSESTHSYFAALEGYLTTHGCPVAFYSDKHTVFRVAKPDAIAGQGMTQFGRALAELNIEIICANSSQAKGRVERVNRTLQDRLVKELSREGIITIEAGNVFLPAFVERFNTRFAVPPARPGDLHRPLKVTLARLRDVLCRREMRYVGQQLQLSWQRKLLILERNALTETLAGKHVELFDFGDGRAEVRWNGVSLPYVTFEKDQRVTHAAVVENKRLSEALAMVREMQAKALPVPRIRTSSERAGYVPRKRPRGCPLMSQQHRNRSLGGAE